MSRDDTSTVHFMVLTDQDLEDAASALLLGSLAASAPRRESEPARHAERRLVRDFVRRLHTVSERNQTRLDLLLAAPDRPH